MKFFNKPTALVAAFTALLSHPLAAEPVFPIESICHQVDVELCQEVYFQQPYGIFDRSYWLAVDLFEQMIEQRDQESAAAFLELLEMSHADRVSLYSALPHDQFRISHHAVAQVDFALDILNWAKNYGEEKLAQLEGYRGVSCQVVMELCSGFTEHIGSVQVQLEHITEMQGLFHSLLGNVERAIAMFELAELQQ